MVPLEQIAKITMGKGPSQIQHYDGKRMMSVSANAQGRSAGEVTADALKIAKAMSFPTGYALELGGAAIRKSCSARWDCIGDGHRPDVSDSGDAVRLVHCADAVMLSLPLSLIGVVVALLLTKGTLNLMSFIGIIMLMGLVAKNAILLLDCARELEREGFDREEALMYGGPQTSAADSDDDICADCRYVAGRARAG
jgi:HAE1 family hydrophobic/amphiphilic exporter-1